MGALRQIGGDMTESSGGAVEEDLRRGLLTWDSDTNFLDRRVILLVQLEATLDIDILLRVVVVLLVVGVLLIHDGMRMKGGGRRSVRWSRWAFSR